MVRYVADRVGVMLAGELVEENTADELYKNPRHEYTQQFVRSVPIEHPQAAAETIG